MKVVYSNLAVTTSILFVFAVRNGAAKRLGQTNAMAQTKQRRELARTKKSVLDQSSEANIQFNKDMGPSPEASFQFNNVITSVEVDNADLYNPNKAYGELDTVKEASVEASKCLDLENWNQIIQAFLRNTGVYQITARQLHQQRNVRQHFKKNVRIAQEVVLQLLEFNRLSLPVLEKLIVMQNQTW